MEFFVARFLPGYEPWAILLLRIHQAIRERSRGGFLVPQLRLELLSCHTFSPSPSRNPVPSTTRYTV